MSVRGHTEPQSSDEGGIPQAFRDLGIKWCLRVQTRGHIDLFDVEEVVADLPLLVGLLAARVHDVGGGENRANSGPWPCL